MNKKNARQPKSTSVNARIKTKHKFTDNSAAAQRARLLKRLMRGPITTIEARRDLDILMPAARIFELRHREGKTVQMVWVDRPTECGKLHRVAMYSLFPEVA